MNKNPETILCAAVHLDTGAHEVHISNKFLPKTGIVFSGYRHADCIQLLASWYKGLTLEKKKLILEKCPYGTRNAVQGFLTSHGRFVDRSIAMMVAKKAGQMPSDHTKLKLFSEDLY